MQKYLYCVVFCEDGCRFGIVEYRMCMNLIYYFHENEVSAFMNAVFSTLSSHFSSDVISECCENGDIYDYHWMQIRVTH